MTHPRPRAALAAIPLFTPSPPAEAPAGLTAHNLSLNESPYPPLPGVIEAAASALPQSSPYPPAPTPARLLAELARRWQVTPDRLVADTGSATLLAHLLQAFCEPGDEMVLPALSFEAYPSLISTVAGVAVRVPLTAAQRHDLPAMAAAVTARTRVVVLCTPNNPTGPALAGPEVEAFLDAVPADVLVVIDEAYREFAHRSGRLDALGIARGRDNVVVLRTFSKAYGLAGLRVGIGFAPVLVAEAVRKVTPPFGISLVAEEAALAALRAEDELTRRVDTTVAERNRLREALNACGFGVPDAQGNFVWLPLGERSAEFAAAAAAHGLTVRPFSGLGVRVTIGYAEANDRLLEVARSWSGDAPVERG